MFDGYNQIQDQIGQLGRMLGVPASVPETQIAANRMDCVDGIEGARAYLGKMLASTRHIVWDTKDPAFYVLQKDANGTAARIQIGRFALEPEPTMEEKYVSRKDFDALVSRLDKLLKEANDNG